MSGSTVNIADFQCWARNSSKFHARQRLFSGKTRSADDDFEQLQGQDHEDAFLKSESDNSDLAAVFDISVAQKVHRAARRTLHSFSIRHTAKVLRFTANATVRELMRGEDELRPAAFTGNPDGSRDVPPAA